MRLQLLLICIVVAVVLGLIFGWQVRGRIAKREAEAQESDRPIRDAVAKRFRSGLKNMVFGGGRSKRSATKKPATKAREKTPETGGDDESSD